MELTEEEIKKYQSDPYWEEWNTFNKQKTRDLIEEEWFWAVQRPKTVLTEDKVQVLEKSLMSDFTIEEACHQAGIPISTFYSNYYQNEEFYAGSNE